MSTADGPWTTRRVLAWMQKAFAQAGLDSARLLAEMLVAHVLSCPRLSLYTDADRPLSPLERELLRDLTARALKHEPVQYLTGEAWFFGLPFHADRRALIPRPCTQELVATVLQHVRATHGVLAGPAGTPPPPRGEGLLLADVCTGSGCVAIALAVNLPGARVVGSDLSCEALELAGENARRHNVSDRVAFTQGDAIEALRTYPPTAGDGTIDYLVANPPYIPDCEWPDQVDPNVRLHEPHLALRGGGDGLSVVGPLLRDGPALLKPGGLLCIEIAAATAARVLSLAQAHAMLRDARIVQDQDGLERVLVARKKGD